MSRRLFVLLFLTLALPVSIFMAWSMPPFFNVDETNHIMRAETALQGQFFGKKVGTDQSGGKIDSALLGLLDRYWPMLTDPQKHVTVEHMAAAREIHWGAKQHFVHIPNTAIYPPNLYLPTMIGLGLGKVFDLPVQDSILLARFFNIGFSTALIAAALWLTAWGRGAMLAIALWPMSVAQYAACSQDGLLIAMAALFVALLSRAMADGRRSTGAEFLGMALLVALMSMSRPTNLLFLLPLWWVMPARIGRWPGWVGPAVAALLTIGWSLHAALFVQVMQHHDGISPDMKAQLSYLATHPLAFPKAFLNTLEHWWWPFTVAMLGWVGWAHTNIVLPAPAYDFYLNSFGLLLLLILVDPQNRPAPRQKLTVGLTLLGSVLAIFFLQYLTFTAPAADMVGGVQGRYFVPLAFLLCLLPPALSRYLPVRHSVPAAALLVLAVGITTAVALPYATMLQVYKGAAALP
ncbi:DUF2142 domain-containing protein [Niveispirillum sp. BGYR6]|uniref:DUF2142 domain-containing protein n=1 Tax=Niveispirillum sp. BGYR6 TaxID=2971249 RepID=UPI0022B99582|nr:DUF2142 domain-containing protein [Niveispirillum sp. BGYR6]MDG5497621.1 DUF2142 domain-containing protein [Niveispirillum sp. BGYR6]